MSNKKNNHPENQCDSNAEVIADVVNKNPKIGYILAIGFSAGFIIAAILATIYGINWVNDHKPSKQIYAPSSDYRPN